MIRLQHVQLKKADRSRCAVNALTKKGDIYQRNNNTKLDTLADCQEGIGNILRELWKIAKRISKRDGVLKERANKR